MKFEVELRNFKKPYYYRGIDTNLDVTKSGRVFRRDKQEEAKYYVNSNGYYGVNMYNKKENLHQFRGVHRIVAETFIPNPAQFEVVNHLDNDRKNNRVENLEWTTQSENLKYAHKQGRTNNKSGMECHLTKYTDDEIRQVCELLQAGYRNKDIAKMTPVSKHYISAIRNREWRKDISKDYEWDTIKFEDRKGANACNATITDEQAKKICKLIQKGLGNKEIAEKVGCQWYTVRSIRGRKTWKHISKKYKW